ncbi:MAG: ankyrin repeat domain-containing protein [Planctomycetota bacterium]|nr:ankyrin repeat domain-containing protein [Planctomycetota bacterium]
MANTSKSTTTSIARLTILSCVALLAAQQAPAPAPDGSGLRPAPQQGTERVNPKGVPAAETMSQSGPVNAVPESVAPVDSRQAIKFEPEILNLGEMSAEVAKTGKIKVINILDTPVKISKIVPGCGCTTTTAPPGELAPGASAEIDITLKPGAKAGIQLTKMVTFQVEGHAPQVLTVKGDVKAYITISQDMLDGPTSPDAPPVVVKLVSVENVPFKITSVLPEVLVSVPTEASVSHEVSIDWKKWEATGSSVKISIMTDCPKAPQLSLLVKRSLKPGMNPPPPTKPTEAAPAIVLAARSADPVAMKAALAAGGGTESPERMSQRTALHFAAESGNMDIVKMLLDAKANPNAQDRTGKTPVTVAAERGKTDVLTALLAAGGDANARDQVQGSPLLWASGLGTTETVVILLKANANPNIQDVNGMTPLMWAAGVGKPETVTVLLAKGADGKAIDRLTGESALMRALRTGKTETVKILLAANPDITVRNSLGMTPFLVACAYGDVDKVKMLVDAGADKTVKDSRGWGAIDHARNRVDARREEVVKYVEPIVPASTSTAPPQTSSSTPIAPIAPVAPKN